VHATGVRLADGGVISVARGGEVLLCCGAIHSPAILQRSGVGPRALLQGLGVPVAADLPVGVGLQDHACYRFRLLLRKEFQATDVDSRHMNCMVRWSTPGPGNEHDRDMAFLACNRSFLYDAEDERNLLEVRRRTPAPTALPAPWPALGSTVHVRARQCGAP